MMISLPQKTAEVAAAIRAKYGSDPQLITPAEREAARKLYQRLLHLVPRDSGGIMYCADDELFDTRGNPLRAGVTVKDRSDAMWGVTAAEWRDLVAEVQARSAA